jgi:multiple sugar transport system permease protein
MALQDGPFLRAIRNTLVITFSSLTIELIIGTGIAVMLNSKVKLESFYRTVLFFPVIMSYVVVAVLWRIMMVAEIGLVPFLTSGFAPLSNKATAVLVVILANVWRNIPFVFTVVLAGFKSLPIEPLEAAVIDGAEGLKKFFNVILPIMKPIFAVVLIMRTMDVFMMFDLVYILTSGGPQGATSTVSTFAVETAFQYFDTGYASALSFIIFGIILLITVFYNKVFKTNVFAK